jgi:SAM-dependent methyltransferase
MIRCLKCGHQFEGVGFSCPSCGFSPEIQNGFPCFAPDLAHTNENFDVDSFEGLAAAEDQSFWFPPRNRMISWAMDHFFPEAKNFLELGCGTGVVLKELCDARPDVSFTGAEIFLEGLRHARQRLDDGVQLVQLDGLNIPFRENFDVIGSFDVIEHIEDDIGILREIHKALKPGGGLMVIVPQHRFLWSRVDDLAGHKRRYIHHEMADKMRRTGFEIVRDMCFGAVTLPLQYVSRRILKPKGATLDETLELDLPRPAAWILEKLLRFDNWTVRLGLDYPFGASQFVIGKKL